MQMQSSEMEKTNPPAYGAPGQQAPTGHQEQPIEMAGHLPQFAQNQQPVQGQSPSPMMHQQSYGSSPYPQNPQINGGPAIGQSPSPHDQYQYAQSQQGFQQQQQHQGFPIHQGVQQPGMVYQQPQQAHAGPQPGFVQQNTGGIVHQQPAAGNAPGQPIYQSVVPIATLGDSPAPIDCPSCHQRAMTSATHVTGDCTHLWALGACFVTCCCCWVPYLIDSMKDTVHKCSKCGVTVATAKKSGGTQVHAFA